jgi:non-heme chloroperoxidase
VFAGKTIKQIADHYAEVIGRLAAKPAVIGHSFGGLLTPMIAGATRPTASGPSP